MSYILDALKKAESDRKLGSVPNIHTQAVVAAESDRGASRWATRWTWAVLALLTSGLLVIAWYQPWRTVPAPLSSGELSRPSLPTGAEPALPPRSISNTTEPVLVPLPTTTPPTTIVAAPPQPHLPRVTEPVPVPVPAPLAAKPVQPKSAPALSAKTNNKPIENQPPQPLAGAVAPPEKTAARPPESPRETPASAEARVPNLRELPQNIQAEIPPLAVTGYIYSKNEADRSVLINNKLLREGDQAAPGVVLEKMTSKEAILNYKGYRYRLSY
jgi:general secretion pathway protein B